MAMASSSAEPTPSQSPPPSNPHIPVQNPTISSLPPNPSRPSFPPPSTSSPSAPLFSAQALKSANPTPLISKIQEPQPPQGIAFPVSASGRGFPPKAVRSSAQPTDQTVTVANPLGYPLPSVRSQAATGFPAQGRPFGFLPDQQAAAAAPSIHAMRPPSGQGSFVASRQMGNTNSAALRGVPAVTLHPKVSQFPPMSSSSDYNNYKDPRDKSRDDATVTIHDRKARLSDAGSGSLYALCRSWVRNGYPQENLPQVGEGIRLLPRPLPPTVAHMHTSKTDQGDDEDESSSKEEHDGSVGNLSAHGLLKGHIKHAKKVRARLREKRLQRIDRYRQRLSLLIPPLPMEQCGNDAATSS